MAKSSTKKDNNIEAALESLQNDLNSQFGAGSAARLDAPGTLSKIDHWTSTRSMVVDSVLRGGRPMGSSLLPFGRQVELSGKPGAGKSSLCAHIAAEVQAQGGVVFVTDTEERIDEPYWQQLGVDTHKIIHITADSLDDVFNKQFFTLQKIKEGFGDTKVLMLWDSLGGTSNASLFDPKSKETPMEQASMAYGREAKQISQGMRLINSIVADTRTCYLYTNHLYNKMNVGMGDPYETYGGEKLKYFATVRLRLTLVGAIKEEDSFSDKDQTVGNKVRIKALKNSMAPVLMERDAVLIGGRGFVDSYTIFDVGTSMGFIQKSGGWAKWTTPSGEEVKFQGFSGFEAKVATHAEYSALRALVEQGM